MTDEEPLERELKFPCPDLDELRQRLGELDAERVAPPSLEENLVLDRGGELEARGCLLRLRMDGHGARLTFKGPASYERETKIRVEHETAATDPKAPLRILENLGFEEVRRYQKHREEWALGNVTIALDHTPIGEFAEFEGDGIEIVAARCGFDLGSAERRSYLKLYSDYRADHPGAPADMVFD